MNRIFASLANSRAKQFVPEFLKPSLKRLFHAVWRRSRSKSIPGWQKELQRIVERYADARPIIVFAPSIQWDLILYQRPQQLAVSLARLGALVFYVEPPHSVRPNGFTELHPRMFLAHVPSEVLSGLDSAAVVVQSYNAEFRKTIPGCRVVYDYIDDLSVFPYDQSLLRARHRELPATADLVLATADTLIEEIRTSRPDAVLCPNAVDYHHFAPTRAGTFLTPPDDLAPIVARGCAIVGYYGALARWFDYDLVQWIASQRPDLSFVLIGPDWDGTPAQARPDKCSNVFMLGPKHYDQLPRYLSYFDVAMIPFLVNDLTNATSPLKLFEYLAGRKPVVTTAMRECLKYEGVLVAADRDDFLLKLDRALHLRSDPSFLDSLDRVAQANTWDERAGLILAALDSSNEKRSHHGDRSPAVRAPGTSDTAGDL